MENKYRATIIGDKIIWDDDVPLAIKGGESVDVIITLTDSPIIQSREDGRRAVQALQEIADRGGVSSIPDPVKWQRDIRRDRPLPGRK